MMEWYKDWFGKEYLLVYPHRNESEAKRQIDFLEKYVGISKDEKILDLCCGNGRHAIELKKLGYDVIGIDLSEELLNSARKKASENNIDIKLIRCDMREIPYEGYFDIVVQFFTSFGYFDTDEENQKVLSAISRSLKVGGKFLIDYLNPDYVVNNLVEKDEKTLSGLLIKQERWIDSLKCRVNKKITIIANGESSVFNESVRMYSLDEIKVMLGKSKLRLTDVYGDFDGAEYNVNSPRMILIGRKI
ncbi:TPA: class I SAM-dependent methyltransferase [Candidatus Poribacteria bacterium]|nr:class I SAM-dependent methyltransferase [Candidatus Poribacteria bacterium]